MTRVGKSLLTKTRGGIKEGVTELTKRLDDTWETLQDEGVRGVDTLKITLEAWEQYTERMETLMSWLRDVEKVVRISVGEFTKQDLEKYLEKCKVRFIF